MTTKQIESFKKVFSISVAALEFADLVSKKCGGPGIDDNGKEMLGLHKSLLTHIEAGTFDFDVWNAHLLKMEILVGMQKPSANFIKGGIVARPEITCKKCGGKCKPSTAIINPACGSPEFSDGDMSGATLSPSSEAVLIRCLKCEDCGHSFTNPEK